MPIAAATDKELAELVEQAAGDVEQKLALDRARARIVACAGLLGFLVADVDGQVPFTREDALAELDRALDAYVADRFGREPT